MNKDNNLEKVCLSQATLRDLHGLDEMYTHILLNHDKLNATDLLKRLNNIKAGMLESVEQIARDNGV